MRIYPGEQQEGITLSKLSFFFLITFFTWTKNYTRYTEHGEGMVF